MKYMLVMSQGQADLAVDYSPEDMEKMFAVMGAYNEELIQAGVFVAAEGLSPEAEATRIEYRGEDREVTDGPYAEANEVFAGYWVLDTATQEEAVEWAKKAPLQVGSITVRRIPSLDEFDQSIPAIQKEREWRAAQGERVS
jgi:hypothetical protein